MKWQYNIEKISDDPQVVREDLHILGMRGWELVSVDNGVAYFKRPVKVRASPPVLNFCSDPEASKSPEDTEAFLKIYGGERDED